jgi:predicted aspartyl protease
VREILLDIKLINITDIENASQGIIKPEQIRSIEVKGLLDTGSHLLVIPNWIVEKLGLRKIKEISVQYADGRVDRLPVYSAVRVEINKRDTVVEPVVGNSDKVLIPNFIIETMDFIIDPVEGKLKPRHPEFDLPLAHIY